MRQSSRPRLAFLLLPFALAACERPAEEAADSTADQAQLAAEDPATAPSSRKPADPEQNIARTMPTAVRGIWHKDDLGRAPTAADCDPKLDATRDYDRLVTVREGGYSYFETGGRIVEVHRRTDSMIDATFDTTYADTPTSERRDFALQADGTLAVNADDGDGVLDVTQYRRCPE